MVLSDAGCPTPSRKDEQLQRDTVSNRERSDDISEFPYVQGFNNNQGSSSFDAIHFYFEVQLRDFYGFERLILVGFD